MTNRGGKGGSLYLGVEIGGTKLQLFAGDGLGKILERISLPVDKLAGASGIRRQLEQSILTLARKIKPKAIGVGFGGPVDWRTGKICRSHQIEGWSEFSLGQWLSDMAKVPVFVENDANVGALGEACQGAGGRFETVFYMTLGSGVGGGLVQSGKIYHGALPGEAEIGHVRLDRSGTIVEDQCSGWAVDRKIRAIVSEHPKSQLAKVVGNVAVNEAEFLGAALKAGDRHARRILNETADDLAFGLSHVTHLLHPEVIVLGGGLALVGEPLRAAVEKFLSKYLMEVFTPGPKVVLSRLRTDAVPVGALTLARNLADAPV